MFLKNKKIKKPPARGGLCQAASKPAQFFLFPPQNCNKAPNILSIYAF